MQYPLASNCCYCMPYGYFQPNGKSGWKDSGKDHIWRPIQMFSTHTHTNTFPGFTYWKFTLLSETYLSISFILFLLFCWFSKMNLGVWQWITVIAVGILFSRMTVGEKRNKRWNRISLEVLEMNGALCLEPFQMMRFGFNLGVIDMPQ